MITVTVCAKTLQEDWRRTIYYLWEKKFQFIYLILINKYYPQEICCRISYVVSFQEFKDVCKNLNKEQVEAAFKRFDQTGNEKLNFKEFSDMMTKRSDSKRHIVKTKTEAGDKVDGAGATGEEASELEEDKEEESPRNND